MCSRHGISKPDRLTPEGEPMTLPILIVLAVAVAAGAYLELTDTRS